MHPPAVARLAGLLAAAIDLIAVPAAEATAVEAAEPDPAADRADSQGAWSLLGAERDWHLVGERNTELPLAPSS